MRVTKSHTSYFFFQLLPARKNFFTLFLAASLLSAKQNRIYCNLLISRIIDITRDIYYTTQKRNIMNRRIINISKTFKRVHSPIFLYPMFFLCNIALVFWRSLISNADFFNKFSSASCTQATWPGWVTSRIPWVVVKKLRNFHFLTLFLVLESWRGIKLETRYLVSIRRFLIQQRKIFI